MNALNSLNEQEKELCRIAAFHEAGHVIGSYLVGWKTNFCQLVLEKGLLKHGATNFDTGDQTKIIRAILDYSTSPKQYEALSKEEKEITGEIWGNRMLVLLAGPATESIFINEKDFQLNMMLKTENEEKEVGDKLIYKNLRYFQKANPGITYTSDEEMEKNINLLIHQPASNKTIRTLTALLLNSDSLCLLSEEINQTIDDMGFKEFVETINNANNP